MAQLPQPPMQTITIQFPRPGFAVGPDFHLDTKIEPSNDDNMARLAAIIKATNIATGDEYEGMPELVGACCDERVDDVPSGGIVSRNMRQDTEVFLDALAEMFAGDNWFSFKKSEQRKIITEVIKFIREKIAAGEIEKFSIYISTGNLFGHYVDLEIKYQDGVLPVVLDYRNFDVDRKKIETFIPTLNVLRALKINDNMPPDAVKHDAGIADVLAKINSNFNEEDKAWRIEIDKGIITTVAPTKYEFQRPTNHYRCSKSCPKYRKPGEKLHGGFVGNYIIDDARADTLMNIKRNQLWWGHVEGRFDTMIEFCPDHFICAAAYHRTDGFTGCGSYNPEMQAMNRAHHYVVTTYINNDVDQRAYGTLYCEKHCPPGSKSKHFGTVC